MISVIIADDHQMFIDGIKVLLEKDHNISIVGESLNGQLLLDLLQRKKTDIVLVDINMPKMDGLDVTKIIRKKYPHLKVIILTMYNTKQYITSMLAAGASGYILKNAGKDELVKAIQTVYNGETYYSQEVTAAVMDSFRKKESLQNTTPVFTKREKDVLRLLAEDLTAAAIADKLNISHHTVDAHRKNMLSKCNVRTTVGLVKFALERGLIDS